MNNNGPDSKSLQNHILDWLNQAGGLLTAIALFVGGLTAIFAAFFPNLGVNSQRIAYGVAIILIIGSVAVYIYQKRKSARLRFADSLEPLASSATLRGLLPFEDGDDLPGRVRDVQYLRTLVTHSEFRFGVLWGESGCGKTSTLRAGLIPKLKVEKFVPLYLPRPTRNPVEAIRSRLLQEFPNLGERSDIGLNQLIESASPQGKKIIVILDQFEEFFLTNRTPHSRLSFVRWLGEVIEKGNLPIVFLISIRADYFAQLQNFAPQIPEPTSTRTTYQLQNFDRLQAKQIFGAAAKADGIPFEPELIQAVVNELETDEFIRPAELQVVGTRLKRKNITRLNQYESLGGARGILSSYINDEITRSPNQQAARTILRLMCADAVDAKSPTDLEFNYILTETIENDKSTSQIKPETVRSILSQLVSARIVICTEEDKYNLVHDYLASYIRTATEGTETRTERADRLLKRYIAEYNDNSRFLIPFSQTYWVQKFASTELKSREKAQELIKKSIMRYISYISLVILVFVFSLSVYMFYLKQVYYFSAESYEYIVLRAGHPEFTFLPGFGQIVVSTGLNRIDLVENDLTRQAIDQGMLRGYWFERVDDTEGGFQVWGQDLLVRLKDGPQKQMYRWLGAYDNVGKWLVNIKNSSYSLYDKNEAVRLLMLLTVTKPELITSEMVSLLLDIIQDPKFRSSDHANTLTALRLLSVTRPDLITSETIYPIFEIELDPSERQEKRNDAQYLLFQLAQARPELITPEMTAVLFERAKKSSVSSYTDSAILNEVFKKSPELITPDMVSALFEIITDKSDLGDDYYAANMLRYLIEARPDLVTPQMFSVLSDFITNAELDYSLRSSATPVMYTVIGNRPELISAKTFSIWIDFIIDSEAQSDLQPAIEGFVTSISSSKAELITPRIVRSLSEVARAPDGDITNRATAMRVLGAFAKAKPAVINLTLVSEVFEIAKDIDTDPLLQSFAVQSLGLLVQAKPELATPEMYSLLRQVIIDPNENLSLRERALTSLGLLVQAKPELATPEVYSQLRLIITSPSESIASRVEATKTVGFFASAKPELITPELYLSIAELNPEIRGNTYATEALDETLKSLYLASSEQITSEVFFLLLEYNTLPDLNSDVRSKTIDILKMLPDVYPERVTSNMLETLTNLISDDNTRFELKNVWASVLRKYVRTNPTAVTPSMLQKLLSNLTVYNYFTRYHSARLIGSFAQASPQLLTDEDVKYLLSLLEDDKDSAGRYVTGYALFEIAFENAHQRELILNELSALQESTKPHVRMAANRILEMIAIGDLATETANNPQELSDLKLRLAEMQNLPYSSTSSENEDGLRFAVAVVLEEIERIEAENQK